MITVAIVVILNLTTIISMTSMTRARPKPERGLGRMRSWEQLEGETLTDFPLWRGIVIKAPQVGPHDGDEDEHDDDDGEEEEREDDEDGDSPAKG